MKTYLKKENGVTMIALIITIIIVIILAGVGISAVVPNGLIQRTEDISKNLIINIIIYLVKNYRLIKL